MADDRRLRKLALKAFERRPRLVERIVPLVARRELNAEPLVTEAELEKGVGRFRGLRVGGDEAVEETGGGGSFSRSMLSASASSALAGAVRMRQSARRYGTSARSRLRSAAGMVSSVAAAFSQSSWAIKQRPRPRRARLMRSNSGNFLMSSSYFAAASAWDCFAPARVVLLRELLGLHERILGTAEQHEWQERAIGEPLLERRDAGLGSRHVAREVVRGDRRWRTSSARSGNSFSLTT